LHRRVRNNSEIKEPLEGSFIVIGTDEEVFVYPDLSLSEEG
jgi:hypothetical protein